ncbi:MAG: hypothetical protein AAF495_04000 [Pseudomonadota bacterium]
MDSKPRKSVPKWLAALARRHPAKVIWTGLSLAFLGIWLGVVWTASVNDSYPPEGHLLSWLMCVLSFPSYFIARISILQFYALFGFLPHELGPTAQVLVLWIEMYLCGYLQWCVILPYLFRKTRAAVRLIGRRGRQEKAAPRASLPKRLAALACRHPGKVAWTGVSLVILGSWLEEVWTAPAVEIYPPPGDSQGMLMFFLTLPSYMFARSMFQEVYALFGVSFHELGPMVEATVTWTEMYISGLLQWCVILPWVFAKFGAVALRHREWINDTSSLNSDRE